jgi:hypothetical protein
VLLDEFRQKMCWICNYIYMSILKLLRSSDETIKPYCPFWNLIHSYYESALVLKNYVSYLQS